MDGPQNGITQAKDPSIKDDMEKCLEATQLCPCHQLNYATSGMLWIARMAAAANRAHWALEDRCVSKTYVAVLDGHITTLPPQDHHHPAGQPLAFHLCIMEESISWSSINTKRQR